MFEPNQVPLHDANRLGLNYRREAQRLPWPGPVTDCHMHLNVPEASRLCMEVGQWFNVRRAWTMTPLENVDAVREILQDLVQLEFIAIPNYAARHEEGTFTTDWLWRLEQFIEKGATVTKFWAAPRGRDFSDALLIDSPVRIEGMNMAREAGMAFMTHIADPDTWFATHYADSAVYGTKQEQYHAL